VREIKYILFGKLERERERERKVFRETSWKFRRGSSTPTAPSPVGGREGGKEGEIGKTWSIDAHDGVVCCFLLLEAAVAVRRLLLLFLLLPVQWRLLLLSFLLFIGVFSKARLFLFLFLFLAFDSDTGPPASRSSISTGFHLCPPAVFFLRRRRRRRRRGVFRRLFFLSGKCCNQFPGKKFLPSFFSFGYAISDIC